MRTPNLKVLHSRVVEKEGADVPRTDILGPRGERKNSAPVTVTVFTCVGLAVDRQMCAI